jgi:hypothetical protein
MTITPLISLAGAAGVTLATAAVEAAGNFADLLRPNEEAAPPELSLTEPALSLNNLHETVAASLARVRELLGPKLAELGISLSQPLKLSVDGLGNVRAAGHERAAEIEQIFATDDALSREFRKLSANSELIRAGREHEQFSQLYAQNPDLAVERFSHLFDDRPGPRFTLELSGDCATPLFE